MLSFIYTNNVPINGADVLHIIEDRNAEEYESKASDEQEGNEHYNKGGVTCLLPCECGD